MHTAGPRPAGTHGEGGYAERAETYLRLLAEAALRPEADGDTSRIRDAAEVLVDAGVLSGQSATEIIADLQLALRVRGKHEALPTGAALRRLKTFRPGRPHGEAGGQPEPWRLLPVGPPATGSRLMAMIGTADRALATAVLHFSPVSLLDTEMPPLTTLTATDDRGTGYRLGFAGGTWAGSTWTGTILLYPAPPPSARRLEISSPNGPVLRADLTAAPPGAAAPGTVPRPATESPGERLLTRRAEGMLAALARMTTTGRPPRAPDTDQLTAILEAAGLLSPLSAAPARLAALGALLGLTTEGPASEVPARWTAVVAYYGRRRRPAPVSGTAAIGVVLPAFDGARFAVAGLHSGLPGSFLHVVAAGLPPLPRRPQPDPALIREGTPFPDTGFSWWATDDAGGWHLCTLEDVDAASGREGLLTMALLPPLAHRTDALTLEVSGPAHQVTATLPLRW